MEIINIEKRTWEMMMAKFESFTHRVDEICKLGEDKSLQKWLDNHDVCWALQISIRTLQTYREKGLIGYAQIGHKIFYSSKDVDNFINNRKKD